MSKQVKDMLVAEYNRRFAKAKGGVIIDIRGLNSITTTKLRGALRASGIRTTVVRTALARAAFKNHPLSTLAPALTGSSAVLYGLESSVDIARAIVKLADGIPDLKFRGASFDGDYYDGKAGVEQLSKLPTREEALSNVLGIAKAPGARLLGIVKEIQERLERGESIAKIG
ncbi:MAG: 50S ribosomal protein L10 [Phycisphaerales bacterium]|nr:50S ribosomal protein L10 [Phycisphaerales bacterium]